MRERFRHAVPVVVGLVLFLAALEVLRLELRAVAWHELTADVSRTPLAQLALALALTALNYAALTGYDLLAFAYIGKRLPRRHIAFASFLAYAVSNNVGLAMLSGASVRYRFYTRWGVTAEELSRIVVSYSTTFWLGLLGLGGLSLAISPLPEVSELPAHELLTLAGWLLMLVPPAYLVMTAIRRRPLRLRGFELPMPSPAIAAGQIVLSAVEWSIAGAVLYVLLPPSALPFLQFIGMFLIAILLGMLSHVPGGLGVFEGLMVLLLKPYLTSAELLPALVVYRAVYYLLPLTIALIVLVGDAAASSGAAAGALGVSRALRSNVLRSPAASIGASRWGVRGEQGVLRSNALRSQMRARRAHAARIGAVLGRVTEWLTPRALSAVTFLAGLVLLFSGATPGEATRLVLLDRIVPIGVIETSHLLGSVAGVMLLILSQGLARRLDAAYYLTATTMVVGMAASLLKGFDYEEAVLLLLVLLILRRARPAFDRRAAFFDTRFSPGWIAAVAGSIGASIWLGFFAFKHVEYSRELWWQFEVQGDASRFLRASVGAAIVLLLFGFARLIRQAPHEAPQPTDADLDDAAKAIAAQGSTTPFLVYLRDKALLFNDERTAFIMYGVQGRTWVALGDPVGPEDQFGGLLRRFLERCDDYGGVPVFYEIGKTYLHCYADLGLTFVKLGEEAMVDLTRFTLEGGHAAKYRQALRRLEKDGGSFRVIDAAGVPAILDQLRRVSDDWLAARAAAEKGFSLGFFDASYLSRFPVAVIEAGGQIQAFANIWLGPNGEELSIDLMRYHRDAPRSVMEPLFVHLMKWGAEHGYRRFALGMAPLSGFETSPVSSLWNRFGAFLYEHGESVYGFQGLRAFKDKFNPNWQPHYLAYPGGLRLPRIIADVSALVAGGYRQIFRK